MQASVRLYFWVHFSCIQSNLCLIAFKFLIFCPNKINRALKIDAINFDSNEIPIANFANRSISKSLWRNVSNTCPCIYPKNLASVKSATCLPHSKCLSASATCAPLPPSLLPSGPFRIIQLLLRERLFYHLILSLHERPLSQS